jgi:7-cyano-7-deazaguanine synthase in queuosine biosynthesis
MINKPKSVLLFSGGLDSLLATFFIKDLSGEFPDLLYVPIKHEYYLQERHTVDSFRDLFQEVYATEAPRWVDTHTYTSSDFMFNFSMLEDKQTAEIPFRNLHLILTAASYGYDQINLVVQKGEDTLSDRRPEFFKRTQEYLVWYTGKRILLDAVFPFFTKTRALEWFLHDYSDSVLTEEIKKKFVHSVFSCYQDNAFTVGLRCGKCSACIRLYVALTNNNIHDYPVLYKTHPTETDLWKEYIQRAETGGIEGERASEILAVRDYVSEHGLHSIYKHML